MKCDFHLTHPRAEITMGDGHVVRAESALETMPTVLVARLYDTYSNKAGILRLRFSAPGGEESVSVCLPPLSPHDRNDVYHACIHAVFGTLKLGGTVHVKTPRGDEWIRVSSLVSMEADPSAPGDEHDEQTTVRIGGRRPGGTPPSVLRSEF